MAKNRNPNVRILTAADYWYLGHNLEEAEAIAAEKRSSVLRGKPSGNNYTDEVKEATYRVPK